MLLHVTLNRRAEISANISTPLWRKYGLSLMNLTLMTGI